MVAAMVLTHTGTPVDAALSGGKKGMPSVAAVTKVKATSPISPKSTPASKLRYVGTRCLGGGSCWLSGGGRQSPTFGPFPDTINSENDQALARQKQLYSLFAGGMKKRMRG